MALRWERDGCEVSDDAARLDRAWVHAALAASYWSPGIPRPTVERAIDHSLCLGLYVGGAQAGFARVVTDRATFGYLCDVVVDPAHRGRGLGRWLVECALAHPDLQGLRRLALVTRDAHELYRPFGFGPMADPTRYLEIHRPDVYRPA